MIRTKIRCYRTWKKGTPSIRSTANLNSTFTQPPARYSEATLIKTLEENGVGRPSTYAPTIETIQKRYYVKLVAKRFEPTELGEIVNKLIVEFFPDIVNVTFTAEMEGKLDDVELGKEEWQKVIDAFYKPFSKKSPRLKKRWKNPNQRRTSWF